MFHWYSDFNYDFALAAIPIQIILLVFYGIRRNLPIRQSYVFLIVMLANIVMTLADLISCEMNEIWQNFPLWLMYLINQLYFFGFIIRGWALFDYTAELCRFYQFSASGRKGGDAVARFITSLPALFVCGLILLTPWTAAIFTFSASGYHNCVLYPTIYYSTYFYIGASFLSILLCWRQMPGHLRASTLGFNSVLLAGIILRKLFYHTLVTSYFSILTILVIYLSAQNPDLYRDRTTRLFNRPAFNLIGADLLRKNIPFHCIIAASHNYESAKAVYGFHQLNCGLQMIGAWMCASFPGYNVFYFDNGNYLLLRRGRLEERREAIVEELNSRFSHPWKSDDTEVSLALSTLLLSSESMPQDILQIHDLIRFAIGHAYVENQRGNYVISEELLSALRRQKAVEAALVHALEERRIEAHYQPIYSTREKRIVGAEALARLNDPELGQIPPLEFIRVAERTGEIMEVGRQIFERVCEFIESSSLEEKGIEFINVNLSPAQCRNEQLSAELAEISERHHVPMSMIDFEITETSIGDTKQIQRQILRLQEHGAELSLDDFGTGTSNLTRLMKLPIHVVKLDMNIVRAYFRGEAVFFPDLVRMFQSAKMKIVVEGVETAEMKDALAAMGCDYEQGYYFSHPVPPKEFLAYLAEQERA